MNPTINIDQILDLLATYNNSVWPAQIVAYGLAAVAAVAAAMGGNAGSRLAAGILAVFWLWTGIVFQLLFVLPTNKFAWIFASVFVLQALLIIVRGVSQGNIPLRFSRNFYGWAGIVFILVAAAGYPLLGGLLGHHYPQTISFAITPGPLVIFTFGILFWGERKVPDFMFILPFLWALLGVLAAGSLAMPEEFIVMAGGILGVWLLHRHNRVLNAM